MNKHLKLKKKIFFSQKIVYFNDDIHTKNGSRTKKIGVLLPTKSQRPEKKV